METKNSEFEKEREPNRGNLLLTPLREAEGGTCNAFSTRLFGKKVFVKEIKPEFADNAKMLAAFRKEAEIGFRLDHRNLPKYVYAEGVLPSDKYIVQEFIDGESLPDFVKANPDYFRSKANVERFIRELADVVDYLHSNQIIHLDLKPENIIMARIGHTLKLVDLGFCATDFYDDSRGFTRGNLAPEGASDPRERGEASDYFGMGNILAYIRSNTPGYPTKKFRKLEAGLLNSSPSRRLASREEIERNLESLGNGKIWATVVAAIIVVAIGVMFIIRAVSSEESVETGDESAGMAAPVQVNSQDVRNIDKEDTPDVPAAPPSVVTPLPSSPRSESIKDGNIPAPDRESTESSNSNTNDTRNFPYQSLDKLKAEMRENINKNFAGFDKMVSAYIREEKFSEKDFKTLTDTYNAALHKTFDTERYKTKYRDLSPSLIDDTMAELIQKVENEKWGPNLKTYFQTFKSRPPQDKDR